MKKQLLLTIVVLFATTLANTAIGQAIHHSAIPQPLVCVSTPLTPFAGVPYDYSAILNPTGGSAYWYATTSTTFIAGSARTATEQAIGGAFVSAATNYQNAASGAASPTTANITWNGTGLSTVTGTNPLFVVVDYTAPAAGCANNMKVYQIIPKNGFTVDIYNADQAKTTTPWATDYSTCVSSIASATFSGGKIVTNYGINYLYFEVVAANFSTKWTPAFSVSGIQAGQTSLIEWSYDNTFATVQTTGDVNTLLTNTSAGVSIFVRVTVNNGTYEGLTDTPLTLTVNGVSDGLPDIMNSDCTQTSLTDDQAKQILRSRPTVTAAAATGAFVTP